jgi:hypothetical protein
MYTCKTKRKYSKYNTYTHVNLKERTANITDTHVKLKGRTANILCFTGV